MASSSVWQARRCRNDLDFFDLKKHLIYFALHPTFCNFAAVNVKTKRHIASWVLLAVFLPMLALSSLHVHKQANTEQAQCNECVRHHCSGHIVQLTDSIHPCVLCQFITLPMLAAAVALLIAVTGHFLVEPISRQSNVCLAHTSVVGLRAPPYRLI